jgi:hypothetical protein
LGKVASEAQSELEKDEDCYGKNYRDSDGPDVSLQLPICQVDSLIMGR